MTQLWSADGQPWDWSNSDELWCHTCHSSLWYVKFITWWWFSTVIIQGNGYHPQAATCIYVNNSIYISQRLCKYVYKGDTAIIRLIIQSSLFCQCNCTYRSVFNSVYPILGCVHTYLILGTMGWVFFLFTSLFFRDLLFFFSPGDGSLLIFWQCQPSTFLLLPCQGLLPSLYWFLLLLY